MMHIGAEMCSVSQIPFPPSISGVCLRFLISPTSFRIVTSSSQRGVGESSAHDTVVCAIRYFVNTSPTSLVYYVKGVL